MNFENLSDDAQIWIYGFDRSVSEMEKSFITTELKIFTEQWKSHGKPVNGQFKILHDRFAVLAIPREDYISGCSVDSSVRIFKNIKETLHVEALDVNLVFYLKNGEIKAAIRFEFQNLIDQGEIDSNTIVFDTTIQTLGELRSGKFERPLSESWHADYFSLSA